MKVFSTRKREHFMTKNWKPSLFTALALSSAVMTVVPARSDVSTISQSIQGAESDVKGNISDVNVRAMTVFKQLKIAQTGASLGKSGETQTLSGKKGDMTIEVQLDSRGANQTHVGVIAKNGTLNWSKSYASSLLDKIVEAG
jgi:hypothetical protein